jgi:TonB-dependent receptor
MCAALAVGVLGLAAAPGEAQSGSQALVGRVSDDRFGGPLPGARVRLVGTSLETATDRGGAYRLAPVPAGSWTLEVSYLGFQTRTVEVDAPGEESITVNVELPLAGFSEEITVSVPILEGQAKALNQQLTAPNIKNVVSADQIGLFPDPNAAEAVQRVPGVSIERDQGEGRYVLVRGTEARLNSMMINGERIPSPEGDVRQVALDVVPADLLQSIEVSKALTPDMDGDAIGGAVNLITQQAPERQRLGATLGFGYNDVVEDTLQRGSAVFGRRFAGGKAGVVLAGSYFGTDRGSQNFEASYDDGDLDELEIRDYSIDRKRYGANAAFDFRTPDGGSVIFQGIYNRFRDQEYRRAMLNGVGDERLEKELKDRLETQEIVSVSARGTSFLGGRARLDYRLAWNYAEETEPEAYYTVFRQEDVIFNPNVSADFIDPDDIRANPLNEDISAYALDGQSIEDNFTSDRDVVGAVDLTLPVGSGGTFFKLGGKLRDKHKQRDNLTSVFETDADLFLSDFTDAGFGDGTPFLGGRYVPGPHVDPAGARGLQSRFPFEGEVDEEENTADCDADEKVYAGYAMAEVYLGRRLMLLPGVRYERTGVDATGYEVVFDEEGDFDTLSPVTTTRDYGTWLPMLHLRYAVGDRSNLRAALTRSLARPNFSDLTPFSLILQEDSEIERGNPDLVATRSWNADLLAEHFFPSVGLISGGVFYKRLDDFIYPFTFEQDRGGETFDVSQPLNGDEATVRGLEVALQNRLSFLPAPLDGLGFYANYTFTDSETEFPGREGEKATLPGQPKHSGNVALSYEKAGFSGRLALNFHGDYIAEVGGEPSEDVFKDDHAQLDLALSQRIADRWRVFVEVNNLTDEPLRFYEGTEDRPIQEEYYSWWGTFGLKWTF